MMDARAEKLALAVGMSLLLLLAAGCQPQEVRVRTVGEMAWLVDPPAADDESAVLGSAEEAFELFAARDETVAVQLVLQAGPTGLTGGQLHLPDLRTPTGATIPAEQVRAFRCLPVPMDHTPAYYLRMHPDRPPPEKVYDILVPLDGGRLPPLDPAERLVLWLDLAVPRSATPGTYAGEVAIRSASQELWTRELTLQVYPFALPADRRIRAIGAFGYAELFAATTKRAGKPYVPVRLDADIPEVRRGLKFYRQLIHLARRHGLDLFDKELHPIVKRDTAGGLRVLWKDYDATVGEYLSGSGFEDGRGVAAWPLPLRTDWPDSDAYGGMDTARYGQFAREFLRAARDHLRGLGAEGSLFVWPSRGGPGEADRLGQTRLKEITEQVAPSMPVLSTLPPQQAQAQDAGQATPVAEMLAPPGRWFAPALAPAEQDGSSSGDSLRGLWFVPGDPPYVPGVGLPAEPTELRAIPCFAAKYGCRGVFLPEVLGWVDEGARRFASGPVNLFYPPAAGKDAVCPSVRLKHLRRGLQDAAYMQLLNERGRSAVAETVTAALARYAGQPSLGDHRLDARLDGWVRAAEPWRLARRWMAEEIAAAGREGEPSPHSLLVRSVTRRELLQATMSVRLERVRGVITRMDERGRLEAKVLIDVYNQHDRPADVFVRFRRLPRGWQALVGSEKVSAMPPGTRRQLVLTARGEYLPGGATAKVYLPIEASSSRDRAQAAEAALPLLVAGRTPAPPTIDGDLSDWPMRMGNAAGQFQRIGRRVAAGRADPDRQTMAFVLYDDRNLYIAFRCQQPDPAGPRARASNVLRYRQLLLGGEDLVEVLLDPGAAATEAEQLYHVVVKANGVMISERGVGADSSMFQSRSWPADARAAVGSGPDVWIVEMSIPREAFGPAGRENVWGINFIRYATGPAEASSWSEATRYYYHPRNLGCMYVGPLDLTR